MSILYVLFVARLPVALRASDADGFKKCSGAWLLCLHITREK